MAQPIITIDDFSKKVLESGDVTLVDFYAPWCGPCQALSPILDELKEDIPAGTNVIKINVDESPEVAGNYGVVSIPTLKVFKGGEIVEEFMGVQDKDVLKESLKKHAA